MSTKSQIRWGWLKFMYIYTIVVAGGFGIGIIFIPEFTRSVFRIPDQDQIVFGIVGCLYVTFGILSILGLRAPLKFTPILLMQLCYKSIWFAGVLLPFLFVNTMQFYVGIIAVIFATFIIGDLIAIPFSYLFRKE